MEKVIRDIKNVGGNIAGIVYNKVPVSAKKFNETYYYSSAPQKISVKNKSEIITEQKRIEQIRKTAMAIDKNNEEKEKTPEEKTSEVLKEFNDYLKKEKKNRR